MLTPSIWISRPRLESDSVNATHIAAQHRAEPSSECPPSLSAASHSQLTDGSGCALPPPVPTTQAPQLPVVSLQDSAQVLHAQTDSGAAITATSAATIRTEAASEDQAEATLDSTVPPATPVGSMNMQSSGDTGMHPTAVTASSGEGERHFITVLMLVGMPGSGKSCFAGALCDESELAWVRVNQVCPCLDRFSGSSCLNFQPSG